MKKNDHGYHRNVLSVPLTSRKMPPPTRGNNMARSMAWPTSRTAGRIQKRGATTQSLATRSGIDASPVATWRPWVTR